MGRDSEALPPFLSKLLLLTQTSDPKVARWSSDGTVFEILDNFKFNGLLKKFFKGTTQTFIRQLHFYGFKKVEVPGGSVEWGFQHEQGLFIQGKSELVKDIRRKTKLDPDSQKLASYFEVQALKSQVSFLQQVVEDLRQHVKQMKKIQSVDSSEVSKKKRPRVVEKSPFEDLCSKVSPPGLKKMPSFGSISLSNLRSADFERFEELDNISELFSDIDLDPLPLEMGDTELEPMESIEDDDSSLNQAVEAIAEATKVKKTDVSKIITFLSQLSVKDKKRDLEFPGCQQLGKVVPLTVQKVGVGAS